MMTRPIPIPCSGFTGTPYEWVRGGTSRPGPRSIALCMSGGYRPDPTDPGAKSTNQRANPRWRQCERDHFQEFLAAHLWISICAGQRALRGRADQVVHTLSPAPTTRCGASSTDGSELSPAPVDKVLSADPFRRLHSAGQVGPPRYDERPRGRPARRRHLGERGPPPPSVVAPNVTPVTAPGATGSPGDMPRGRA